MPEKAMSIMLGVATSEPLAVSSADVYDWSVRLPIIDRACDVVFGAIMGI